MRIFLPYVSVFVLFVCASSQVMPSAASVEDQVASGWFARPAAKVAGVSGAAALVLITLCVKAHSDMKVAMAVHNEQRLSETRNASLKAQKRFATLRKGVIRALGLTGLVLLYAWITRASGVTKLSTDVQNPSSSTGVDAVVASKPAQASIDRAAQEAEAEAKKAKDEVDAKMAQKLKDEAEKKRAEDQAVADAQKAEAAKKRDEDKAVADAVAAQRIEAERVAALEATAKKAKNAFAAQAARKLADEQRTASDATAAAQREEDARRFDEEVEAERKLVGERRAQAALRQKVRDCLTQVEAYGYKDLSVEERARLFADIDDAMLEKIPSGGYPDYRRQLFYQATTGGLDAEVARLIATTKAREEPSFFGGRNSQHPLASCLGDCLKNKRTDYAKAMIDKIVADGGSIAGVECLDRGSSESLFFPIIRSNDPALLDRAIAQMDSRVKQTSDHSSLLHEAAIVGNQYAINRLRERGLPLNIKDYSGSTPLQRAVWNANGSAETIEYLLKAADEDGVNDNRNKALTTAITSTRIDENVPVIAALVRAGATVAPEVLDAARERWAKNHERYAALIELFAD